MRVGSSEFIRYRSVATKVATTNLVAGSQDLVDRVQYFMLLFLCVVTWTTESGKTAGANNQMKTNKETARVEQTCCPIMELRQYTLHEGKRDILIDLFDQEFVETQEAVGIKVVGQFRDLDHQNRFVWLRGFRDMITRAEALKAFYGGPVWKAHREAANATMIDSGNVLLLRPAYPESGFSLASDRLPPGVNHVYKGLVAATIYYLNEAAVAEFVDFFDRSLKPLLIDKGASIVAYFVSENSVNTFPALPVREGEHVFVWFSRFQDQAAYDHYVKGLAHGKISEMLAGRMTKSLEVLKLSPTARSQLHD